MYSDRTRVCLWNNENKFNTHKMTKLSVNIKQDSHFTHMYDNSFTHKHLEVENKQKNTLKLKVVSTPSPPRGHLLERGYLVVFGINKKL